MFAGRSMAPLLWFATLALAQHAGAQAPTPPVIAPAQAAGLDAGLTASSHGAGPAPLLDFMELGIRAKVRRLRIAGWTLVGAGVLMIPAYFIDVSLHDPAYSDEESGAFMRRAVLLYGFGTAAILATGGAMLLRARLILRRFRRLREAAGVALDAPPRLDVGLALRGARMTLRF